MFKNIEVKHNPCWWQNTKLALNSSKLNKSSRTECMQEYSHKNPMITDGWVFVFRRVVIVFIACKIMCTKTQLPHLRPSLFVFSNLFCTRFARIAHVKPLHPKTDDGTHFMSHQKVTSHFSTAFILYASTNKIKSFPWFFHLRKIIISQWVRWSGKTLKIHHKHICNQKTFFLLSRSNGAEFRLNGRTDWNFGGLPSFWRIFHASNLICVTTCSCFIWFLAKFACHWNRIQEFAVEEPYLIHFTVVLALFHT